MVRTAAMKVKTNRKVLLCCIVLFCLAFLMVGCGGTEQAAVPQDTNETQTAEAPPVPEKANPENANWNKSDIDAMNNGNIQLAAEVLKTGAIDTAAATVEEPQIVIKAPWNYYGKAMKFQGVIAVVQDYPPGSDIANLFGSDGATDIVIQTEDGTIVEFFGAIGSGSKKIGDSATFYGYPAGTAEVDNKVGGSFTHLIIVGNVLE